MKINMEIWLSMFIILTKIAYIEAYFWTLLRRPYISPGATMKEIHELIPGKDCIQQCNEMDCAYLALIPQDWSKFEELGKIPGISFNRRLEMAELKHCILFDLRSAGGKVSTAGYLAKGVEMVLEGKLVTGKWLLASRVWEKENGLFDPKDFQPPAFFKMMTFTDKSLEAEVFDAAPPTSCPDRGSALSSQQPSTHEDKDVSSNEEKRTTVGSDEDSEEESPIVEEQTDEAEETTEGVFELTTEGNDETEKSEETSRVVIDEDETTAAPDTTKTEEETDFEVELTTHDADPTTGESSTYTHVETGDATTSQSTKTDDAKTTTQGAADKTQGEEHQDTSPLAIDEQETTTKTIEQTTDVVETSVGTDSDAAETTEEPSVQGEDATTVRTTTEETVPTTTEGWPVKMQYSYWCGIRVANRFDRNCATESPFVLVENAFAPYVTENLKGCEMVGFTEKAGSTTLVEATTTKPAKAWCVKTPCGGMNVPLAYEYSDSKMAQGQQVYQLQTSNTSSLLCYVYSSLSHV